jgi:hypothetical protein
MKLPLRLNRALSGTVAFVVIAVVAAGALLYAGRRLYDASGKSSSAFDAKLGELTLQLAVIVVVGALVKAVIDWGTGQRTRHLHRLEARMDFLRRVRAAHIGVEYARDLLNAHRSAKTYGEQLRRLMELRPEVEEISEDLTAAPDLFEAYEKIREGLEGIIAYLKEGGKEYVGGHDRIDAGYKAGECLQETIEKQNMKWVKDFMNAGPDYRELYVANLSRAKGTMRLEVYR